MPRVEANTRDIRRDAAASNEVGIGEKERHALGFEFALDAGAVSAFGQPERARLAAEQPAVRVDARRYLEVHWFGAAQEREVCMGGR